MKIKKIILILLVISNTSIYSQIWDRVYDHYYHSPLNDVCITSDNGVVIGTKADIEGCQYPLVIKFDSIGQIVWQKMSSPMASDVVMNTHSNYIIYAGYDPNTDDVGGNDIFYISKVDQNGNSICEDTLIIFGGQGPFHASGILELSDGNILMYATNKLIKADASCQLIWLRDFSNVAPINEIHEISNGNYLIAGANKLYKTNDMSQVLNSSIINYQKLMFENDTIYISDQNIIIKIDTNLIILDTIDLSMNFSTIHKIIKDNNIIWIKGIATDGSNIRIAKYSDNFQEINYFIIPSTRIDLAADFCISKNKFILAFERMDQCAVSYFDTDNFTVDTSFIDIYPENVTIDNIQLEFQQSGGQLIQTGFRFDTHVIVKNNSDNIINSVNLFSFQNYVMNCLVNYDYQKYSNLALLPQQSISLDFPGIFEMSPLNNEMYHYCVKCIAPNTKSETDIANNSFCGDYFITSQILKNYQNSGISIFPNPFYDNLFIQMDNNDSRYLEFDLYNLSGVKILSKKINSKLEKLDCSDIEKGFYFASLQTDKINIIKKIIKIQ